MTSSRSPCTSRIGGLARISAFRLSGPCPPRGPPSRKTRPRPPGPRDAAQADVQRHHGALAEADQGELRRRQLVAREFRVEEGVEARTGQVDAAPALVRVAEGEGEPLPAHRRHPAGLGRMRGDEGGVREPALPLPADLDQVVAVGAVAVQEDDELLRPSGFGRQARAGDRCHLASLSRAGAPTAWRRVSEAGQARPARAVKGRRRSLSAQGPERGPGRAPVPFPLPLP